VGDGLLLFVIVMRIILRKHQLLRGCVGPGRYLYGKLQGAAEEKDKGGVRKWKDSKYSENEYVDFRTEMK
jgi:hypothetical protein